MKKIIIVTAILLTGCSGKTHDFLKAIEGKAYDQAAKMASKYCERTDNRILRQERLEARREIRQRGFAGPEGPLVKPPKLDDKTAYGDGPVVRIWCEDEDVPSQVWDDFVREK